MDVSPRSRPRYTDPVPPVRTLVVGFLCGHVLFGAVLAVEGLCKGGLLHCFRGAFFADSYRRNAPPEPFSRHHPKRRVIGHC